MDVRVASVLHAFQQIAMDYTLNVFLCLNCFFAWWLATRHEHAKSNCRWFCKRFLFCCVCACISIERRMGAGNPRRRMVHRKRHNSQTEMNSNNSNNRKDKWFVNVSIWTELLTNEMCFSSTLDYKWLIIW